VVDQVLPGTARWSSCPVGRAEYANVIRDLLALDTVGSAVVDLVQLLRDADRILSGTAPSTRRRKRENIYL